MESVKEIAQRIADRLPEDATWQQFVYRVLSSAKIAYGLDEIENGKGIPHEVVMKEMEEWLESSGPFEPAGTGKAS